MSFTLIISLETRSPAGNHNKMRAWEKTPLASKHAFKTKVHQAHQAHDPGVGLINVYEISKIP